MFLKMTIFISHLIKDLCLIFLSIAEINII